MEFEEREMIVTISGKAVYKAVKAYMERVENKELSEAVSKIAKEFCLTSKQINNIMLDEIRSVIRSDSQIRAFIKAEISNQIKEMSKDMLNEKIEKTIQAQFKKLLK